MIRNDATGTLRKSVLASFHPTDQLNCCLARYSSDSMMATRRPRTTHGLILCERAADRAPWPRKSMYQEAKFCAEMPALGDNVMSDTC